MTTQIPIEVSSTRPLKFRWVRKTDTINGPATVTYNSAVHPTLESALLSLIKLVEKQEKECDILNREIDKLKAMLVTSMERIATQSELLSKKAEKVDVTPIENKSQSPTQPLKKSK